MLDPSAFANLSSHGFLSDSSGIFWEILEQGSWFLKEGQGKDPDPWDSAKGLLLLQWEHFHLLQDKFLI